MAKAPFNAKDGIITGKSITLSATDAELKGTYPDGTQLALIGTAGPNHVIGSHDAKMSDVYIRAKTHIYHQPTSSDVYKVYTEGNKPTALEINAVANTPDYAISDKMFDDKLNQRRFEVFATGPNDSGLTGIRGGIHIPAGGISSPNSIQLAFRTINNEYTIRQTDGTTTSPWQNLYHTGYKPSARAINALHCTTEHLQAAAGSSERWIEDIQSTNRQRLSFLDSKAGYFGFRMALSANSGVTHTPIFEVSTKNPDGSASLAVLKAFNKNIYWEGNKPTAADVSALSLTGDLMTGPIQFGTGGIELGEETPNTNRARLKSVSSVSIIADSDSSSTTEFLQLQAGKNILKVMSSAAGTGDDKLTYNDNEVFHAGNVPALDALGAYSKTGGKLTGNVEFDMAKRGIVWNDSIHATTFAEGASIMMDPNYEGVSTSDYLVFTKTDENSPTSPDGGMIFKWKARNADTNVREGEYLKLHTGGVSVTPRLYVKSESAFGDVAVDGKVLANLKGTVAKNYNWIVQANNPGTNGSNGGIKAAVHDTATAFGAYTQAGMKAYIKGNGTSYFAGNIGIGVAPQPTRKLSVSTAGADWVGVFQNTGADKHGVTVQVVNPDAKALEVRDSKRNLDLFVVKSNKTVYSTNMGINREGNSSWALQTNALQNGIYVNTKTNSRWGFLSNFDSTDVTTSHAYIAQHNGVVKYKVTNAGDITTEGKVILNGSTVSSNNFSTLYVKGGNSAYAAEFTNVKQDGSALHLRAGADGHFISGNNNANERTFSVSGAGRAHFLGSVGIGSQPSDTNKLQIVSTNPTTARLDNTGNVSGVTGLRIKVKSTNNGSDKYFIQGHKSEDGSNPEFSVTANGLVKAKAYSNKVDVGDVTATVTTPTLANSNIFRWTLKSNTTIANPNRNGVDGGSWFFYLIQDSTGGRGVSWGNQYHILSGTVDAAPNAVNICNVICDGTDNYDVIIMQR